MRCEVCGMEAGVTHLCTGLAVADLDQTQPHSPDVRLSPLEYVRLGWQVARLQERAIVTASRDNNCFLYGVFFFMGAFLLIIGSQMFISGIANIHPVAAVVGIFISMNIMLLWQLGLFGICHLVAKFLLGGRGKFAEILRPLAISSFLLGFAAIPVVGVLIAGIWWTLAVLSLVFEEVHKVERRNAIFTVIGINVTSNLILSWFGWMR